MSTPNLLFGDNRVASFYARNDIHIYINNKLEFGFRSGPNVTWGNLCSCMSTVIRVLQGYSAFFRPRLGTGLSHLVEWNVESRELFDDCKKYDLLVALVGDEEPRDPGPDIFYVPIVLRPRVPSRHPTPVISPARTPGASTPPEASLALTPALPPEGENNVPSKEVMSDIGGNLSETRQARAARRSDGIPSPKQSKGRATQASQRCWEVYRRCCITGLTAIAGSEDKPKDIVTAHIFQHAYQDMWIAGGWEVLCTDHGPPGVSQFRRHDYTGYHHICCLNNMVCVRSDLHELIDSFEVGVDVHDSNRIISFSNERESFTVYKLLVDDIPVRLRPLPQLLTDHLAQGVARHCLYPGDWSVSGRQSSSGLASVAEELPEIPGVAPGASQSNVNKDLMSALQDLSLEGGQRSSLHDSVHGTWTSSLMEARIRLNRFAGHRESGEGKHAFENYIAIALSPFYA